MLRKPKPYMKYNKDGIVIRRASLGEEYDIGGWITSYDWIKMGYEYSEYENKYSDISYVMVINKEIYGYFLAYNEVVMDNNSILPLYGKSLVLFDFAVDIRTYSKYTKIFINFMIRYAKQNGYNVITIRKIDKYSLFNNFIIKNFKAREESDKLYIMIENPVISSCKKHLTVYENDKVELQELYFLYDLNFDILKTVCKIKLNDNDEIRIDRLTGLVSFPSVVKLTKDQLLLNSYTKTLIYLVKGMYHANNVKPVVIDYDVNNPNYYEAIFDGILHVGKYHVEMRDDNAYINTLINRGYDKVVPNQLDYDMNDGTFCDRKGIYNLKRFCKL